MSRGLLVAGAVLVIVLAPPAYVPWATWHVLKLYEQGEFRDE